MTPYSNLNRTFGPQSMSQAVASSELSSFLQAVNNTMGDLIVGQGYSRERATKTILQEIARSVYPSTLNVTDEQTFEVMRRNNLGMEQAYRALALSQSLDHIMEQRKLSTREALVYLTDYIGNINVSLEPSEPVCEKDTPKEHPVRIILPDQSTSKLKISSGVSTIMHLSKKDKSGVVSSKNTKHDSQKRERSDSVPDEVVAKLGESISINKSGNTITVKNQKQSETAAVPSSNANHSKPNVTTPAVGRTKRNRGATEENELHVNTRSSTKRSRMNST